MLKRVQHDILCFPLAHTTNRITTQRAASPRPAAVFLFHGNKKGFCGFAV